MHLQEPAKQAGKKNPGVVHGGVDRPVLVGEAEDVLGQSALLVGRLSMLPNTAHARASARVSRAWNIGKWGLLVGQPRDLGLKRGDAGLVDGV